MKSLYQSELGKKEIISLYENKLTNLGLDYTEREYVTRFGKTHVIVVGESTKPPLIVVHGSNGCAPIALETYPNLYNDFQVFAIDVIAQPNKSAPNRVSMKDLSYGEWMNEMIELLHLKNVTLAGDRFFGLMM